jgi:hypothetical protein
MVQNQSFSLGGYNKSSTDLRIISAARLRLAVVGSERIWINFVVYFNKMGIKLSFSILVWTLQMLGAVSLQTFTEV